MARPALIVGLGGTGQWILTWLKRELLLANNGHMPDSVRLLAIDTAPQQIEADWRRDIRVESVKVGGVTLDRTEFIYIGGNSRPLALETRDGRHPQLGRWFRTEYWLDTQPPAVFVLDNDAGRIRQFGRLAVYKDIMGGDGGHMWSAFRNAIDTVGKRTDYMRPLEIIVVGSFAGGTGSGMFLDVALILRKLAKEISPHHVLRGFFALPSVFAANPSVDMKACAFAAWRELNRFMVIDSDFPMSPIDYVQNSSEYNTVPGERIFDACYLVDGKRKGAPMASEARYGVFPMISEVISAILDEQAGQVYSDWVYTSLAVEYGRHPTTPMYSAIGAYTIQIPANYIETISSHAFCEEMLLRLLSPGVAPEPETGRLPAEGAMRHLTLANKAANREDYGFAGRQRADTFLTGVSAYEGQMINPTIFMARVAGLLWEARERGMLPQVVDRLARAGMMGGGAEGWLRFYPEFGIDPQFAALIIRVREHTELDLVTVFSRREKEKAEDFWRRIVYLDPLVHEKFGSSKASGDWMVEDEGTFGDVLNEVHDTQMIIFRQMLRLRLLSLLMGHNANPLIARTGKLGYTWDYFDGVASDIDWFLQNVMEGVNRRRQEMRPAIEAEIRNRKAEDYLTKVKGKTFLVFWESPAVKKAEMLYLRTEQEKMDLRREDILHRYVVRTLQAMKEAAEQARDSVQSWIWHLSTGDPASGLPGLWNNLLDSEAKVVEAHGWDKSAGNVQRLVAEATLPVKDEDLAKVLGRWQWTASFTDGRLNLGVNLLPEDGNQSSVELSNPADKDVQKKRARIGQIKTSHLLALGRRVYGDRINDIKVVNVIIEEYGKQGGVSFAHDVARDKAEPLFVGFPSSRPKLRSNLIRVMTPANYTFFSGPNSVESELRNLAQLPQNIVTWNYPIQVVGSENPFKLTLVRSDDLYDYDEYAAWEDCRYAYAQHVNDEDGLMRPVNIHNFAAEANAVEYETRLVKEDKKTYRPLHPRVVMLLENPEPLRQFLYLLILGNITEVPDRTAHRWELDWGPAAGLETIYLTRPWTVVAREPRPNIFNAAHGYAIRQRSLRDHSQAEVDIDYARIYISDALAKVGPQAVLNVLNDEVNGKGKIGELERAARDMNKNTIIHPDLNDLAIVFRMMLQDDIKSQEDPEGNPPERD